MDCDITDCTVGIWLKNEGECLKILEDETQLNKIPLLNVTELHNVKDNRLVRFRGMVQDMHTPEYYMEKYESFNKETKQTRIDSGKYTDICICKDEEILNLDSASCITSERQTYIVVSDPALNDWVKNIEVEKYSQQTLDEKPTSSCYLKRNLQEEMEIDTSTIPINEKQNSPNQKKQCTNVQNCTSETNILSQDHLLNIPLPGRIGKTCHIKVYENSDSIKLQDLFEFVGFFSANPQLGQSNEHTEEYENQMEVQTHNPPASVIPRIHCVLLKKLNNSNPLISKEVLNYEKIQNIRSELLVVLTQLLLGDKLAAEYLIFHLISEIYLRRDFMPLGKFSLNLSNVPIIEKLDYVKELYNFIELLVVKSHYLPMTLENMNTLSLIPKKDYECNRLTSGILQLSANTHLVLDETKLTPGKLDASGVNSVKALANVIKNQKLVCDFNFYPLEFDCDIPMLVISEGKSILPSDCHVVLQPEEICVNTFAEIVEAAKHFLKPTLLNDIRIYLTQARKAKYDINDQAHELIQNEFVNMRQNGKVTGYDLHNLLVLTRLVSLSNGKYVLDEESWKTACKLEEERKSRIVS